MGKNSVAFQHLVFLLSSLCGPQVWDEFIQLAIFDLVNKENTSSGKVPCQKESLGDRSIPQHWEPGQCLLRNGCGKDIR